MGEKLVGSARTSASSRDRAYVTQATPTLRALRRRARTPDRRATPRGCSTASATPPTSRTRSTGCTRRPSPGRGCARWAACGRQTGEPALARRCRALAARLEARPPPRGPRLAATASGRLALPPGAAARRRAAVRLADGGAARQLLEPRHAVRARVRALRARQRRGARARCATCCATARACSGSSAPAPTRSTRDPVFPTSGTDEVYGINVARFLADNDEADQLVLSLYGTLAAAMTPGHVRLGRGGERGAARGGRRTARCTCRRTARATPPSSRRCARCSCTRRGRDGTPRGLELAFATPRAVARGRASGSRSRGPPTSFGPVSYALEAQRRRRSARPSTCPTRCPPSVKLRLRLPRGQADRRRHARRPPVRRASTAQTLDLSRPPRQARARRPGSERAGRARSRSRRRRGSTAKTKRIVIRYRAHDGRIEQGASCSCPRGTARATTRRSRSSSRRTAAASRADQRANWGNLPARGGFAVVNPDARGRRLAAHSWGYKGHIDDLARMPKILKLTLPWLRIDQRQIYAFGGSMGGQETLLLVAPLPAAASPARRRSTRSRTSRSSTGTSAGSSAAAAAGASGAGRSARACASSPARRSAGAAARRGRRVRARSPITYARAIASARACRCSSGGASPTGSCVDQHASPAGSSGTLRRAQSRLADRGVRRLLDPTRTRCRRRRACRLRSRTSASCPRRPSRSACTTCRRRRRRSARHR